MIEQAEPISPQEFEALMTIVRAPPAEPVLSEAGRWRKEYREAQFHQRIIGVQHDLFGAPAVTRYHRHAPQAPFKRPPVESIDAKLQRIKGDPLATFGPKRADRPAYPTQEEKDAIIRGAANWLHLGQRVQIVDGPTPVDPAFGGYRFIGRMGAVHRLCSSVFADHVYVFLDPVGAERAEKIAFVELRDLAPVAA